jgi:hypothetical protein
LDQASSFKRQASALGSQLSVSAAEVSTKTLILLLNFRLSFAYISSQISVAGVRFASFGDSLCEFCGKSFFSGQGSRGRRVEIAEKFRGKRVANAIRSPQQNEFWMGFPEVAPTIHKHDARTIAIALVHNSPSRTQQNNLSGND